MRIIFLSRYQGKVERGVENYAAELTERLRRKCQVKILTSFWQLLRSNLRRSDLKIIYPLNGYWQTLGCRLYAWLTGAKLVVGGHAGIGRDDRWNLFMFPDLFIAFSQKGYEWAKKVNPFVNIVKIPHGVNLTGVPYRPSRWRKFARSPSPARYRSGWPQTAAVSLANLPTSIAVSAPVKLDLERPIFVTAAHLEPYKRVDLTVKAVAKLKKGSLLVLGEGPMEKEIDELGKRLLGDRGNKGDEGEKREKRYLRVAVSHEQVAGYLRAADVFTLVSEESEAFGLVYLEAMACNLPIVATDDSLRRELIGEAGVFVKNPEDRREYGLGLTMAVGRKWGRLPRQQSEKFDWEKIADRYLEEFTGL